jgi:Rieske Fe-S protein
VCGASAAGMALCACSDLTVDEPRSIFLAGTIADINVGSLRFVSGAPIVLGRDIDGVYAMTSVCTHANCRMDEKGAIEETALYCACHGARFDAFGTVTKGPARRPLDPYLVAIAVDGTITIDTSTVVAASTRALAAR